MTKELTHLTKDGQITMVDVSDKAQTKRLAQAEAFVSLSKETLALLKAQALPKGDCLACARVGAIMAAKKTAELIPLCHPIMTSFIDVRFTVLDEPPTIHIVSEARSVGETGVEMEAIIAAEMAATIIYDMCKAVQRDILITGIRLLKKCGGKSGTYTAKGLGK
ncbi:MAG: cyclic pyranopterin monophosphate synthase MoaC [Desulfovibrio sp.]|nr:cyclic pyranopterin monophosphate synthase MoaC [Desulfovibrio sp.]